MRDAGEDAGETALDLRFLLAVARTEQDVAGLGGGLGRHLFGAHDQRNLALPRFEEVERGVNGRRTRCAGVLKPDRGLRCQFGLAERDQRTLEILLLEAVIHHAHENPVDLGGRDLRMVERGADHARHQRLCVRIFQLAKGRMGPTRDECLARHAMLLPAVKWLI